MEGEPIRPQCEMKSFTELRQEAFILHIVFGKYYFVKWGDSVATHDGHSASRGSSSWENAHKRRVEEKRIRGMSDCRMTN